jgi:methylenetetrahydrofolate--tRNA-(uracil-5-)-methyltransferase
MRQLGSLVMRAADSHQVPAGGHWPWTATGSGAITAALEAHPLITILREDRDPPPAGCDSAIVATGPPRRPRWQTDPPVHRRDALAFFDAIAPIVHRDSIDSASPGSNRATTGRARRFRRGLRQLPADARTI